MIFDFPSTRVLVTGGTAGIGLGIATAFVTAGADVTVTGTRGDASEYDTDLGAFSYVRCRLSDTDEISELPARLGSLDVLINNAGQSRPDGRSEWEPDVFDDVVGVDLLGSYRVAAACRPLLAASEFPGGSSIVNNLSLTVFFGQPLVPAYGAAKAGLGQLTRTMAIDWAQDGIRVNAVAPGMIATNFASALDRDPVRRDAYLAKIPLHRFGTPQDVANAMLFLASPESAWITGTCLVVDGGHLAGD